MSCAQGFEVTRHFSSLPAIAAILVLTAGVGAEPRLQSATIVDMAGVPARSLDLSGETFVSGNQQAVLAIRLLPVPTKIPDITWSSSDPALISVSDTPGITSRSTSARPAGATYVQLQHTGYVTVSAHIGPPDNVDVSIPVYGDRSIALGCGLRYQPGLSFEANIEPDASRQLDYYMTTSQYTGDEFDQCRPGTPYYSRKGGTTIHFPAGGSVVPTATREFRHVSPDEWRDAGSDSNQVDIRNATLLFKTRSGRIVKTDGYRMVEVLPGNTAFPDSTLPPARNFNVTAASGSI